MPTRCCLSPALLFALVACDSHQHQYRPTTPRRGELGEALFEAVRLAQLHGTDRHRIVVRSAAPGGTRLQAILLARVSRTACAGGTAPKKVWMDGHLAELPLNLSDEEEIELEVAGTDVALGFDGDTALDLSLAGGCARVPLSGASPERAWRPESHWSVGTGLRMGFDRSSDVVTSIVARGGRWLGPVRLSLEAGVGISRDALSTGPFAIVTELFLVRIDTFVVGAQVGYEATHSSGSTVHGPRVALTLGLTPTDGAGIPRGPRQRVQVLSVFVVAPNASGADEPTLLVGLEWFGTMGL